MFGGGNNFGGNGGFAGGQPGQGSPQAMTNPMGSAMNIQEVSVASGPVQLAAPRSVPMRTRDKSGRRAPAGVTSTPNWPWSGIPQR